MLRNSDIQKILLAANVAFWLLIAVRVALSRRARPAPEPDARPAVGASAPTTVASGRARVAILVVGVTMVGYLVLLGLWTADPRLVGPALLPGSLPLQMVGIASILGGLALMAWSYRVLHSFRLLARIEPGHELCTDGPYARLRHPVYAGLNLFYVGTSLLLPYLGFLIQVLANVLAYDYRARVEEHVLVQAFGDQYRRYMERTRRFIPGVY